MPIWPFGSKQPKVQDEALADLAQMFLSNPEDPTPGSESLDAARCDCSLESLRVVDAHLEAVRARRLEGPAMMKLVLRCGAYVGEVVRRRAATGKPWHWITYDEAVTLDARLTSSARDWERPPYCGMERAASSFRWRGSVGISRTAPRIACGSSRTASSPRPAPARSAYFTKLGITCSPIILRQRSCASRSLPLTPIQSFVAPRSASCSIRAIQSRGAPASAQRSTA